MTERKQVFNIYCDESCHLPGDGIKPMLLGCIWSRQSEVKRLTHELKDIKEEFGARGELKWGKVSKKNLKFYLAIVEWFFSEPKLLFRVLVVPNKQVLDHQAFNDGSHDDFYYKMYFWLLSKIVSPDSVYKIYLDVKDTRSRGKTHLLREVICFDKFDFHGKMIEEILSIRSHEAQLLQLADFFIGAVAYSHRGLSTNLAKLAVIERIESHLERPLTAGTGLLESKFNIFVWTPRGRSGD